MNLHTYIDARTHARTHAHMHTHTHTHTHMYTQYMNISRYPSVWEFLKITSLIVKGCNVERY